MSRRARAETQPFEPMKKQRAEKPLPKNRPSKRVGSGTLVRLAALLRGHRNLEMWCSFPKQKPKLYYVWSSGMGPMADRGEPTLEAAIEKFWRDHRREHFKRSKPNQ